MPNINFCGFLVFKDKNHTKCTLNTNNVVGLYQNKDADEIKITSVDKTSVILLGYDYAQVQKALIEADIKGYSELKPNDTVLKKPLNPDVLAPQKKAGKAIMFLTIL